MNRLENRRKFNLLDLAAMVVGYSLASLLARAFWPRGERGEWPSLVLVAIAYAWLGLAMSGPILLVGRKERRAETEQEAGPEPKRPPESRTWAELAWLIIGFYWIGLTVFVVPVRLHESRIFDTVVLGLFPIGAALLLRVFRGKLPLSEPLEKDWTHNAALALLVSWPFTWVALILLGKSIP